MSVAVGTKVLYSPHLDHGLDRFIDGSHAFEFFVERGEGREPMKLEAASIRLLRRDGRGSLIDHENRPVKQGKAVAFWPATVTAVHDDDSADLDITAPSGYATLHYQKIPYDAGKKPHSFHLQGE